MENRTKRNTVLFIAVLLLAGAANVLSRGGMPAFEALMASINYLAYTGLLLYWIQSVRARLLPSRARNRLIGAVLLMVLYQLLRVFKYRFAVEASSERYTVYLYFAPMTLIPTLFLMTCLCIRRGNREGPVDEALLLIPPGLLSLLAMTNDLHGLVYAPKGVLSEFRVDAGTYTAGPVFYALYAWMILSFAAGLILLFRENRLKHRNALPWLLSVVGLWLVLLTLHVRVFDGTQLPRMYNNPEIHMFGMLGVFEVCIRGRMIPHNEDYPGFFRTLRIPALVTDRALQPVYRSGSGLRAEADQLRASLLSPVYLTPDLRLSGRKIRGGYAFWAEDESEVRRVQERLEEANGLIESENSLIQAETEQREKDAWLRSRHRIYHEIAQIMYPCQQRISGLLKQMMPDTPAFRDQLAFVSVLNAYIKRKTNLMLLSAEKDSLTARDLFLALKESANYLSLAGLRTDALQPEEQSLPAGHVIALYDAFEAVAEQLIGRASSLMVSWKDGAIILATETDQAPETAGLPLPVRMKEEDGILYMEISAQKDGGTA